jgi:translation initiation factor eIF-2B subunit alpha
VTGFYSLTYSHYFTFGRPGRAMTSFGSGLSDDMILKEFKSLMATDMALPVAAMNCYMLVLRQSTSETWMGLEKELASASCLLKSCSKDSFGGRTNLSLISSTELFFTFLSRAFLVETDFDVCKKELLRRAEKFASMSAKSRLNISRMGGSFIEDRPGFTVLTYGNSRVVQNLLLNAFETKKFNLIVVDSPEGYGRDQCKTFVDAGIPTQLVMSCAIASAIETTNFCIVGAELVTENGGIVNKLGTFALALCAKALNKPFYVAVESYKFSRMSPLTQRDVTDLVEDDCLSGVPDGVDARYTPIDLTPAEYISLLFTDIGVLTPPAVSEELMRLHSS